MQGLWKSSSRKYILKDKARFVRKHYREMYQKEILYQSVTAIYCELFVQKAIPRTKMYEGYKEMQNIIEKKQRASLRNWLAKKDWESQPKEVYGTKSILWLID